MGMKRAEIARKFDRDRRVLRVADFIDTPVRRYSSGMNARLGFSIAAHLEPQVLIVDEVLAVGDFAFQQRAFGRIKEMVNQDVTAILVSHQLERIASLCKRAVLLRRGEVAHAGSATETIGAYVNGVNEEAQGGGTDSPLLIRSRCARHRWTDRLRQSHPGPRRLRRRRPGSAGRHIRRRHPVRSMQNGKVLFATSSMRLGVSLAG